VGRTLLSALQHPGFHHLPRSVTMKTIRRQKRRELRIQ